MPKNKVKEKVTKKVGTVKAVEKPKLDYHLEVIYNDMVYKGEAVSMEQALLDFINNPVFPYAVKTRVVFKAQKADKSSQLNYFGGDARKLFNLMKINRVTVQSLAERMTNFLA